jgi:DNA-binding MarR family transcriptional regulator
MAGPHTLAETERTVVAKLDPLQLDYEAMAAVSNLFRAANAARNHLERSVLAEQDLTWTAFVVLWVVWIWEPIETREIAEEAGVSKATLSGVLATLESRGLVKRTKSKTDGRLVLVDLTPKGRRLMTRLFPAFNVEERHLVEGISPRNLKSLTDGLRSMTVTAERTHSQQSH